MTDSLPRIGVVIIGVNVEKYISACIKSVKKCEYLQNLIEIVYVDGGSTDNSITIARKFKAINVIELNDKHPTPGRGRNIGWKSLKADLIQFLDGDTILHPNWFKNAVPELNGKIGAVCGHRRERYPEKNLYHLITDIEWGYTIGLCKYFGGDVLIIREALEKTGGFDDNLIAGEDPELSYRIRHNGWNILRIDTHMTTHDINMTTLRQYLKRAHRSGYAYAQIGLRYIKNNEKLWLKEFIRIAVRTLGPIIFFLAGLLSGNTKLGLLLGILILCRPLFGNFKSKIKSNQPWKKTILYSIHIILVIYPQFLGILRYFYGVIGNTPLKNNVAHKD
jgi:glycosyltransferase involved in cell wall biosynthesis